MTICDTRHELRAQRFLIGTATLQEIVMKPLALIIALTVPLLWSCDGQPTQPSDA